MTTSNDESIVCSGGCKSSMPTIEAALQAGWSMLQITGRWRCGKCDYELRRASTVEGAPPRKEIDSLPKTSIGALKKLAEAPQLHEKPG